MFIQPSKCFDNICNQKVCFPRYKSTDLIFLKFISHVNIETGNKLPLRGLLSRTRVLDDYLCNKVVLTKVYYINVLFSPKFQFCGPNFHYHVITTVIAKTN